MVRQLNSICAIEHRNFFLMLLHKNLESVAYMENWL